MSKKLLFPHSFKLIGWILLVPSFVLTIILTFVNESLELRGKAFAFFSEELFGKSRSFQFIEVDILPTIVGICFIIGGLFVAFS